MGVELDSQYKKEIEDMEDDGVNYTDSDLVYHVRDALHSVQYGDTNSYDQLVGVMHHSQRLTPDDVALLLTSLKALSGAVSYIDECHHDRLLQSIFGMSIWNYGPDVMEALLELIIALAASNGKYIDPCLKMLVTNFVPPMYLIDILKLPRGQAKKEQVLSRLHTALEDIAHLIPMAASRLSTEVVSEIQRIPTTFKKDQYHEKDRVKYRTEIYVENMLRLESGAIREFVGSRMLMAVVDKLIDLDVAIGWDDILRDDSCKGIFAIELEDADEVSDDDEYNDYGELPRTLSHKSLGENVAADLLDSLMVRIFEHLELCANNKRLNDVFETLLDSFMLTILNTYKSKFAQFVMFYACALDPENCGVEFAERLRDRFTYGENPLTRMSAVAYLASYLARAKFLPIAFVASTLKRLVDWCSEYCRNQDGDMNPKAHRVFYSGCQAILYVLCFRMSSMMDIPWLKSQLLHMPLEQIMKHKLGPLKVCLPSIVEEFLKQAKAAHLFTTSQTSSFEDVLESEFSKDFGGLERLDMFFPFDPCLLRTCDRSFIRPNFVYWKDVRTTYGSDEEDSSDEDIAEDFTDINGGSYMEEGMATSLDGQHLDLDEFDYAMNKMSITPKNRFGIRFGERMQMPSKIRPSTSPESL
ncbi:transcription initiation factor ia, putative [Ricinus communis]|uniref:Transcription initiation factor ia, putative n=1 Tax=Ricinus communis TaxID=3988 RepID=B9SEL3_RICCO|nr:transcription initiation factor ia, putative [Ricinus communis]|eukprot:XP_002524432.1 RNA polymerase I-specific transcription initiation factor RRN3 [Ricinus communis]